MLLAEKSALERFHTPVGMLSGIPIYISRYAAPGACVVIDRGIFTDSLSSVLARIERERRREDAIAAFAPERALLARIDRENPHAPR